MSDTNTLPDLLSQVTMLENELDNLKNNLTKILIQNKNLKKSNQILADDMYYAQGRIYDNKINFIKLILTP